MIPYGKHYLDDEDIRSVVDVLKNGPLTQGPLVQVFEQEIAAYVGAKYAVAVSSGTAALHLAAIAAGVGPGTSLITSPITFVASANAGLYTGAEIAFADICPETLNMSSIELAKVVERNSNVRAVVPVHFAGLPCDMPAIKSIADDAGVAVIEDASHALGACYPDGSRVGCCKESLMTTFSFHPVKAIAAGEGGMITTNDFSVYRRLMRLRSHGINKFDDPLELWDIDDDDQGLNAPWYYEMQELGYNYRISDINCSLALSQFKKLDYFVGRRRDLAARYDAAFSSLPNCKPAQISGRELSGHHLYVLKIDFKAMGKSRSGFMTKLKDMGIGSQVHYIPVPAHPHYRRLGFSPKDYPNSLDYYSQALSIPLFYELTDEQQTYVIHGIERISQ